MIRHGMVAALVLAGGLGPPAATATAAASGAVEPRYAIADLGALPGGTSGANAINNAGVVVGVSTVDGVRQHAVRWSGSGRITDLGVLPGGANSVANAVNDAGQVAGQADRSDGGFRYPVRWNAVGAITDLGGPAPNRLGEADGIDPAGRAVGGQRPADSEGAPVGIRYALDGTPTELGDGLGLARGVNARGEIVGDPAYAWRAGRLTPLPDLTGGRAAIAYAVNDAGVVVGVSATSDPNVQHAVRWAGDVASDLGTLDGIPYSEARAVNAAGTIVGTADPRCMPCAAPRAWIWQPGAGRLAPLDALIPSGSGWTLRAATGINDRGQIVGTGMHGGALHAYLLTPTVRTISPVHLAARLPVPTRTALTSPPVPGPTSIGAHRAEGRLEDARAR
jgi:probable HAF family extracellular repeat protein